MNSFTKWLIVFYSTRKKAYYTLVFLVTLTLVLYFFNRKDYAGISFMVLLAFLLYCMYMTVSCWLFRRSKPKFRVYYSFSERRQYGLSRFITECLNPALWLHNIDYYDFREGKRFNFLNEDAVCAEIDKNLAASDIFVRFINYELAPGQLYPVDSEALFLNAIKNPFTRKLQAFPSDYAKYEVDISYDRFGFTAPYNRFQIVPLEMCIAPMPHIQTIFFATKEPAMDLALKITQKFIAGYNEKQRRIRSKMLYRNFMSSRSFNVENEP